MRNLHNIIPPTVILYKKKTITLCLKTAIEFQNVDHSKLYEINIDILLTLCLFKRLTSIFFYSIPSNKFKLIIK